MRACRCRNSKIWDSSRRRTAGTSSTPANPQVLDGFAPELIARGFRQSDIDAVRQYVDTHDLARAKAKDKYAVVLGASKVAKKFQKIKRPFDDDAMLSYFYQKAFGAAVVDHQWSAGLLTSLDSQRQRILASYMQEQSGTWFIGPTSTLDAIKYERNLLLRPDSEQFIKTAFEEGRL